jgi:hypothetical protein
VERFGLFTPDPASRLIELLNVAGAVLRVVGNSGVGPRGDSRVDAIRGAEIVTDHADHPSKSCTLETPTLGPRRSNQDRILLLRFAPIIRPSNRRPSLHVSPFRNNRKANLHTHPARRTNYSIIPGGRTRRRPERLARAGFAVELQHEAESAPNNQTQVARCRAPSKRLGELEAYPSEFGPLVKLLLCVPVATASGSKLEQRRTSRDH